MSHLVPKLTVTITKTAQGEGHYIQVMSADGLSINFVCIADEIEVHDLRALPWTKKDVSAKPAVARDVAGEMSGRFKRRGS